MVTFLHLKMHNYMADANFPLVQFPVTTPLYPSFSFNIYAWLSLNHLCMDIHN